MRMLADRLNETPGGELEELLFWAEPPTAFHASMWKVRTRTLEDSF
jgi:hypothetical protein